MGKTERTAEILKDEIWVSIEFENIKKGDTFRLFEPDGKPVKGDHDSTEWIATSDAYLNEDSIWSIKTDR